ncbi:N-acetylglucosamine-6-phosphate deacetylase [Luteococcus peritonei]
MRIASHSVVTGLDDVPRPLTLELHDGWIVAVHEGITDDAELLDGSLVPGFVDSHCHGGAGADFTDPDPARVAAAIEHHRAHGTTSLFASTVTAAPEQAVEQVARLRGLVESGELAGIHLEGPFLAPERKGAHPEELLCDPRPELLHALLEAGAGTVRMVTLAPERQGGMSAVELLAAAGVVPAFGHSDADAATTRAAVDAGARVATHLFNAMRPIHHREPGPVPVLLDDERVVVELICDGVHLAPEVALMALAAAGANRVALVTDAMSATGCADGRYQLGELPVQVSRGTARIVEPDGRPGAIAGSTLTMDRAVRFLVAHGVALATASRMASTTPAAAHGLDTVGRLAPGCRADVCLLGDGARLLRVMRHGHWKQAATT